MISKKEVWIGFVHVEARKGCKLFDGEKGGYVNALAWAGNVSEYKKLIRQEASEYEMVVIGIKDIEPLNKRMQEYEVHKNIVRLAKIVIKQHCVRFDTFYTYPSD